MRQTTVATASCSTGWQGNLAGGPRTASLHVGDLRSPTTAAPKPARAAHVQRAFTDKLNGIAQPLRLSMTNDQGREMASHQKLTESTGIAVYFCDPHSDWQRGSNENTNCLVRQYVPKGTDLSGYSQQQLDLIADEINMRPRKGLGVRCPLAVYRELLVNHPQHSTLIH